MREAVQSKERLGMRYVLAGGDLNVGVETHWLISCHLGDNP